MSRWRLLLFMLAVLSSLAVAQTGGREFSGYQWYDDGISFTYPQAVAEDAIARFSPASSGSPETVQVVFQNYDTGVGWTPTGAEIDIMPVSALSDGLFALLNTVETLAHSSNCQVENALRAIEPSAGASFTIALSKPLDFQTGIGARYVELHEDGSGSVSLSYRYHGKTSDGAYLISATFPVNVDWLGNPVLDNAQALDALSENDFMPSLASLDTLIRSLSVTAPEASLLTSGAAGTVDYKDTHFRYEPSLAYRVEVETVPGVQGAAAENTMYGPAPGYHEFTFVGYPALGNVQAPQVFVMPVAEFPAEDHPYGAELARLQTFLAARPTLSSATRTSAPNDPLPMLPLINAAQTLVADPQYIRFANGEGVRYLTFYSQDAVPLTATDLFYTFVGMTDDEQHVVAARLPLNAAFLPAGRTAYDIQDYERFLMNYQTYLDGLLLQIEVMDDAAFSPQIAVLDALVASIEFK